MIDNLASRDIPFSAVAEEVRDELVYDSNGKAAVSIKLSGQADVAFGALAPADAGAKVSFGKEATVFVALAGLRQTRIDSIPDLSVKIIEEYWKGWWQPEYVVITHLVEAQAGTILLAAEQDSSVELRARADIGESRLHAVQLATSVQIAHSKGLGYQLVCQDALTPFSRAFALKKSFWKELHTHYRRQTLESATRPPVELLQRAASEPGVLAEEIPQPDSFFEDRP
ncbi:MAG: hypothetical protein ACRDSL_07815 [Pseudonocardiaceae bacterium]